LAKRPAGNERLRRAREERHWTQAEVAQAIGTSSFTVSRWELGVQSPQPHFREKLCGLFGLTPAQLGLILEQPASAGPPARAPESGEARARRDLQAQVWRYWVDTELETAVGGLPRIELRLVDCPGAVDDPLRVAGLRAVPRPDAPEPGATIADAYRSAGERLLVLGDPGAGKTTLLLELTRGLLEESRSGRPGPVPVVFHLASWAEAREPLARWLVDELHRRYGVARRLGRTWVETEQVLPLLDGLDEVGEEHRPACAAAIDDFLDEHGQLPMVVCCRTAEHEALGVRLRLRGAVVVAPLTRAQVERYLDSAAGAAVEVRTLLSEDERLRELLGTPLFLRMIVRTYGGEQIAVPALHGTLADRRRRVLAGYVRETLARPRSAARAPAHTPEQTVGWLAWLAGAMRDHSEGVFHLDWMQASWLASPGQRRLVTLGPAALLVLVGGLIGLLDMLLVGVFLARDGYMFDVGSGLGLPGHALAGALAGVVAGSLAGLLAAVFTHEARIAPAERLSWSWPTLRANLPAVVAAVLGAVAGSLLVDRVLSGVAAHLAYGLLLVVLFTALTRGGLLRRPSGPWRVAGAMAALAVVLTAAAAAALLAGVPPLTLAYRLGARLVVGLSLGLMFGPRTPLCETVPAPGRGIEMSLRRGLTAGLLSGTLAALVFGVTSGAGVARTMGVSAGLVIGLLDGLSIGAIVGAGVTVRRGGGAYLRHVLLRRLLVRAGAAPRDYVGFLEHAAGLVLLRRRGGGYEFAHRMLLDHFADLRIGRTPVNGAGPSRREAASLRQREAVRPEREVQ
jgi:transcriptional regulator with XRE-family HTH domain